MINWKKYFNAIYLLTYAGYNGRRKTGTSDELKRVGIADSGIFHVYENIQTPLFQPILQAVRHDSRMTDNLSMFSCTFGHYCIWKICELRGYRRTLILEDDVVFLNDVDRIEKILENTPKDYDLMMYTHFVGIFDKVSLAGYISQMKNARDSNVDFIRLGTSGPDIASCGTYAISNRFASVLCGLQERYISVCDVIINHNTTRYKDKFPVFNDLLIGSMTRYYSTVPISLQKYYMESMTESNKSELVKTIIRGAVEMYKSCGVDVSEYSKYDEFIKDIIINV